MQDIITTAFAPMGLEAVAMRIGDTCGHNYDAKVETVDREGYCAIKFSEEDSTLKTYAFVLNFFNEDGDYADFYSFGISLKPTSDVLVNDDEALSFLDRLFRLVNRQEFIEGNWDMAVKNMFGDSVSEVVWPNLEYGFHYDQKSEPAKIEAFTQQLKDLLADLSHELGGNATLNVWEYQNIDY